MTTLEGWQDRVLRVLHWLTLALMWIALLGGLHHAWEVVSG